jgi:hypothetical protein
MRLLRTKKRDGLSVTQAVDLWLTLVVVGAVVLALCVDCAALVGWVRRRVR